MSAMEHHADAEPTTLERTLALVGDRWSILIIRAALRGLRRFDEFQADLGIARPILTARLKRLVDGGVMAKEQYRAPAALRVPAHPRGCRAVAGARRAHPLGRAPSRRRRGGHRARARAVRHRARAGLLVPPLRHDVRTGRHPRCDAR
jgi:hypothetical protein